MTVDWTKWLDLTPEQQEGLLRRYRQIVKAESEEARLTNYARMERAMKQAGARAA